MEAKRQQQNIAFICAPQTSDLDVGYRMDGHAFKACFVNNNYETAFFSNNCLPESADLTRFQDLTFRHMQKLEEYHFAETGFLNLSIDYPVDNSDLSNFPQILLDTMNNLQSGDVFVLVLIGDDIVVKEELRRKEGKFTLRSMVNLISLGMQKVIRVGIFAICCHAPSLFDENQLQSLEKSGGFAVIDDPRETGNSLSFSVPKFASWIRSGTSTAYKWIYAIKTSNSVLHLPNFTSGLQGHNFIAGDGPRVVGANNIQSFFTSYSTIPIPMIHPHCIEGVTLANNVLHGNGKAPYSHKLNQLIAIVENQFAPQIDPIKKRWLESIEKEGKSPVQDSDRALIRRVVQLLVKGEFIDRVEFHGGWWPALFSLAQIKLEPLIQRLEHQSHH